MGINIFVLSLIVISLVVTNLTIEEKKEIIKYKNVPLVTFTNSTMYDINEKKVKQIVVSSQALNYKNRDELYDATILTTNKQNNTNSISAQYILKQNMIYKLYQNVNVEVKNDNNITLFSDYLEYNEKKEIFSNNKYFEINYNLNNLIGDNLYFDIKNNIIKAHNTHFKLQTQEK